MSDLAARSVLVIGAGATGSPAALCLAASGVGRIGVADDHEARAEDPPRAFLQFAPDAGVNRAESAAAKLRFFAPGLIVEPYPVAIDAANAEAICSLQDAVVDCSGDPITRVLVSDACKVAGVGLVSVGAGGERGEVAAIPAGADGCLRCAHGGAPPPRGEPATAPLAGALGALAAHAALALLRGATEAQRLALDLAVPGLDCTPVPVRSDCPACRATV